MDVGRSDLDEMERGRGKKRIRCSKCSVDLLEN